MFGGHTYIQSGNVLFHAPAPLARAIPARIAAELREGLGLETPVVTRTAAQWRRISAAHPFGEEADPKQVAVAFLSGRPPRALVAGLDPERSPGDRFRVSGSEVLLHCPNGFARTRLTTAWLEASLKTVSTVRNWATIQALRDRLG